MKIDKLDGVIQKPIHAVKDLILENNVKQEMKDNANQVNVIVHSLTRLEKHAFVILTRRNH